MKRLPAAMLFATFALCSATASSQQQCITATFNVPLEIKGLNPAEVRGVLAECFVYDEKNDVLGRGTSSLIPLDPKTGAPAKSTAVVTERYCSGPLRGLEIGPAKTWECRLQVSLIKAQVGVPASSCETIAACQASNIVSVHKGNVPAPTLAVKGAPSSIPSRK